MKVLENYRLYTRKVTFFQIVHKKGDIFSSPPQEPLAHCVSTDCAYGAGIAVTFTFMHLADAFIQSDLQLHSGYTFLLVCISISI